MSRRCGEVSIVTGRFQAPTLRLASVSIWILGGVGAFTDATWARLGGLIAIILVLFTPLARVLWLMVRWLQEGDVAFVWIGAGTLVVIAIGAVVVSLGLSL